jgi:hypothetical protein
MTLTVGAAPFAMPSKTCVGTEACAPSSLLLTERGLNTPIASLYTLPLQMNLDDGLGLDGNGSLYQLSPSP